MRFWKPWTGAVIVGPLAAGEWVNFFLSNESIALVSALFCTAMFTVTLVLWMTWPR